MVDESRVPFRLPTTAELIDTGGQPDALGQVGSAVLLPRRRAGEGSLRRRRKRLLTFEAAMEKAAPAGAVDPSGAARVRLIHLARWTFPSWSGRRRSTTSRVAAGCATTLAISYGWAGERKRA